MRRYFRPWYSAAAMAAALVLMMLASNIVEYISLSRQNQAAMKQMSMIYMQVFPGSKNVHNPYQRMQSEMRRLQGTSTDNSFSEMLVTVAPVARSINQLDVRQLRYQQGKMEILVELPSLQELEQFKLKLTENTPWNVELRSADASGKKVQGRLLISKSS
jgi:general secretion pathway protein L